MENSGIRKEYGKVTVDHVQDHKFKDQLAQAQIRQIVTKIYPSASVGNNKQDSLFDMGEFNLEGGKEYASTRVTWIDIPKGKTKEDVEAMLAQLPNACIYQEISDSVILTDNQEAALEAGLTDLEAFESKQIVRDADGNEVLDESGNPIYTAKFFSKTFKEDVDHRVGTSAKVDLRELANDDDLA